MQTVASQMRDARTETLAPRFALSFLAFCVLVALLIAWKPIQLSIATVLLFAGPHNWIEFRYFLARMPARWGRSKPFFSVGLGGVAALALCGAAATAAYANAGPPPVARSLTSKILIQDAQWYGVYGQVKVEVVDDDDQIKLVLPKGKDEKPQ